MQPQGMRIYKILVKEFFFYHKFESKSLSFSRNCLCAKEKLGKAVSDERCMNSPSTEGIIELSLYVTSHKSVIVKRRINSVINSCH